MGIDIGDHRISNHFHLITKAFKEAGRISTIGGGVIAGQLISAVTTVLLARTLEPAGFGMLSACLSAAAATSFLFNLGLDAMLLRLLQGHSEPKLVIMNSMALRLALWTGFAVPIVLFFNWQNSEIYGLALMSATLLDLAAESMFRTVHTGAVATHQATLSAAIVLSMRALRAAATIALILFQFSDPVLFVLVRFCASLIVIIASSRALRLQLRINAFVVRELIRSCPPFAGFEAVFALAAQGDVAITAFVLGDPRLVGILSAALGFFGLLITVPASLITASLPRLSQLHRTTSIHVKNAQRLQTLIILFSSTVIAAIVFLFSERLTGFVFGPSYAQSADLLRLLCPVLVFRSMVLARGSIFVASGHAPVRLFLQAASTSVMIILHLALIPKYGLYGTIYSLIAVEASHMVAAFILSNVLARKSVTSNLVHVND